MTKNDKKLLNKIFQNKDEFAIAVDNDAVWIVDKSKSPEDDDYWVGLMNTDGNLLLAYSNI